MDSLKQYFEIQRKDNEILKQEIITNMENIFSPSDAPPSSSNRSPTKYCNYITELCHYEQKINHKLTEINFELRKFILQNKCPKVEPPPIKKEEMENSFDDIETLKANSSKLISKLDKLRNKQCQEIKTNPILKIELDNDTKIYLSNVQEISSQHKRPLICSKPSLTDEPVKNLIPEIKFFDLDENVSNRELTSRNNGEIRKNYNDINAQLYSELKIDSVSHIPTKEGCKSDIFEDEHSRFKTFAKSPISKSKTVDNNDQYLMDEILDFKLSELEEAGQCKKSVSTNFDSRDSLSKVMLKNLMELSMSKSTDPNHYPNIDDDFLNQYNENVVQAQDNVCEIKTESKEKLHSMLQPDSDISSYYDSESDIESTPSEELLEGIPKYKPEDDVNMCDSSKEDYLKGLKEKTDIAYCMAGERKENGDNSQALSSSDLDKEQVTKKEDTKDELIESPEDIPLEPKPENVGTIFTAEEKIKKLGLEDRKTIFEKTRQVAVLPDLRLRPSEPSVTDAEKLKKIRNRKMKFEIPDNVVPTVNTCCVFSHVESPSEFYIHPDTEESKLIDSLNDLITEKYSKTKSPYLSKYEAFEEIGRYCCAYVKDDKMYYRAEIVDWLFDKAEKLVMIKLVDYGNSLYAHFKHLRMLTKQFCLLPKLAVRCYLPLLYPPGSTKIDILTGWPAESTEAFFELTGLSVENSISLFKIVYVEEERDGVGIDLYQVNGKDRNTIGELLIDLGHAVQIVLREDDPMGILSDEEDIKNLEKCENINEVILGYDPKDEARICKFTKPDGGRCFKRSCKLEHTKFTRGGFTTDQTLTYAEALSDLYLPKPNDFIAIRFTTFISATCFYVNIVHNVANLTELEYIMNNPANRSSFERFKILPAHGEVVLVKHWQKRWLRGKVRHHLFNEKGKCTGVQVFMVDYGDIIDVALDNIRQIKTEYLNLPFQAIECALQNYKESSDNGQKEMDRFFYENMVFRKFTARVLAVSDMHICADIYFKCRNLGDILVEYGFLTKVNNKILFPHPKSVIIPG